ncbi:hypothetical protein [Sagittula sp. MA-2]|jgi:hypothetical protein|uniref:hypothetical protein n=1 Tax=Sagittula sp. MA-2 TaxID=3048007 RepID=UPI0024C409D6|nr:hypothetical protein [Sagittula sp. MA-2]WHZ35735.1 hypothetical protein QNI11_01725 [Sagittula sp. MA-2]
MTRDPNTNARIRATIARAKHLDAVAELQRARRRKCTQAISKAKKAVQRAFLDAIRAEVEAGHGCV